MNNFGQIIYNTLKADGLPDPLSSIVVAQARHETNNFTSTVFRSCNNAFGYKAVYNAPACLLSPEGNHYEQYGSVADSAHEISAYLFRRVKDGSFPPLATIVIPEQYARLLKNVGYYGDSLSNYTGGLVRWFRNYAPTLISAGSLLAFGAAWYLLRKKKR